MTVEQVAPRAVTGCDSKLYLSHLAEDMEDNPPAASGSSNDSGASPLPLTQTAIRDLIREEIAAAITAARQGQTPATSGKGGWRGEQ